MFPSAPASKRVPELRYGLTL
eukprot:gene27242-biopygen17770